jgi:tetratricopeptide (TPR) repeat protein
MRDSWDLFFSYRTHRSNEVARFLEALEHVGLRVWRDQSEVDSGTSISSAIRNGLSHSTALLAYYTPDYNDSRICQWELATAWMAGTAGGDPFARVCIVVNPADAHSVELDAAKDSKWFIWPDDQNEQSLRTLATSIKSRIEHLENTLGSIVDAQAQPNWFPHVRLGSTRFCGEVTRDVVASRNASADSLGEDYLESLAWRHELGAIEFDQGEYQSALENVTIEFDGREKQLGYENRHTIASGYLLGRILLCLELVSQSVDFLKNSCLSMMFVCPNDFDYSTKLSAVLDSTIALMMSGASQRASALLTDALHRTQEAFGRTHSYTLRVLHYLAIAKECEGEVKAAKELLERELKDRRSALGSQHPSVIVVLNCLEHVCRLAGEHQQSEKYEDDLLMYSEENVMLAYNQLLGMQVRAAAHEDAGRPERSLRLHKKLLGLTPKYTGKTLNAYYLITCLNIACHRERGEEDREREMIANAIDMVLKAILEEDSVSLFMLANALASQSIPERSLKRLVSFLDMFTKNRPSVPANVNIAVRRAIANMFCQSGQSSVQVDAERSRQYLRRCVDIRRDVLGEQHPETCAARITLALILLRTESPEARIEIAELERISREYPDALSHEDKKTLTQMVGKFGGD